MKKLFIAVVIFTLIVTIFTSITFAGVDTLPTYTAGRIIIVNPGA